MNIITLVKEHLIRYPGMKPRDIIKLIYQNEFGGGHMIDSFDNSLERLQNECATLNSQTTLTSEVIGDNLIRVYLGKLDSVQILTLNQIFVASSKQSHGNLASFINKLETIKAAMVQGEIDYDNQEFEVELKAYEKLNFPPISHSEQYRKEYKPHYRLVDKRYFQYFDIINKINQLLITNKPLTIAIYCKCGSFKSFLSNLLCEIYDANLFKMDDFFLRPFQRTEERLSMPGGNVDYERFKETVIDPLLKKKSIKYQRFNCSKMALDDDIQVIPYHNLNIIEGTYSLHPYFGKYYDYAIGLDISDKLQEKRILDRNGAMMLEKFKNIWIPLENKYFEAYQIFKQVNYLYHVE